MLLVFGNYCFLDSLVWCQPQSKARFRSPAVCSSPQSVFSVSLASSAASPTRFLLASYLPNDASIWNCASPFHYSFFFPKPGYPALTTQHLSPDLCFLSKIMYWWPLFLSSPFSLFSLQGAINYLERLLIGNCAGLPKAFWGEKGCLCCRSSLALIYRAEARSCSLKGDLN